MDIGSLAQVSHLKYMFDCGNTFFAKSKDVGDPLAVFKLLLLTDKLFSRLKVVYNSHPYCWNLVSIEK